MRLKEIFRWIVAKLLFGCGAFILFFGVSNIRYEYYQQRYTLIALLIGGALILVSYKMGGKE